MKRSSLKRGGSIPRKTALRRTSRKAPTIKELDKLLHQVVRARDKTCQLVSAGMGKCGGNLQACHIYPKGTYQAMRYVLDNVLLGCWRHHSPSSPVSWHANPMVYGEWFRFTYRDKAVKLRMMAATPGKIDRKLDRLYLEGELAKHRRSGSHNLGHQGCRQPENRQERI